MAPISRILDIDGNRRIFDRLRTLVESRNAIAFSGAGASAGLYPLWPELVNLLIKEAVKRGTVSDADRATWERLAANRPQQVVRGVKDRLGRHVYGGVLRDMFGLRSDPSHTAVQGLLVRLPFRGHVTTNYDPGLLEARRLLRPDVPATGYATWQDHDALRAWHTGTVFGERACPVLYAHGVFERSDTIVLGSAEYREAYRPGAFRELLRKLWSQEQLVFVGFGFTDTWFDTVAEEVLGLTREGAGDPRHIAIVGLPDGEPYAPELRTIFREAYDAEVLFYPVAGSDHSQLATLLAELGGAAPTPPTPTPIVAAPSSLPAARWVHETTEDQHYTEPAGVLDRLSRWAADPRVRAVAITGIGGLGKTALVGHWLKGRGIGRPARGLFGWSFNANRVVPEFLEGLVAFASSEPNVRVPRARRAVDAAIAALRAHELVVVLDGLEALQESPGDSVEYGEFLDDELREFLDAACRLPHAGLIVLTSRFPFADLAAYLGSSLRLLELHNLTPAEGASLLSNLGAGGDEAERRIVSRRLDGHPLALRALAAALVHQPHADPGRLLDDALAPRNLRDDDPLEVRLRQLLVFYETHLPATRRALLGVVALFPGQVDLLAVIEVVRRLSCVQHDVEGRTDGQLRADLSALVADGLLTRESGTAGEEAYACHPVIRAHFRSALLRGDADVAVEAVGLLTAERSGPVRTREELGVITNAIAILLQAGAVNQADSLYRERLDNGWVFMSLVAPREGLQCALAFVADDERRALLETTLSKRRLSYYLHDCGLWARNAAEFGLAETCLRESAEVDRQVGDDDQRSVTLSVLGDLLVVCGRLAEAETFARTATQLVRGGDDDGKLTTDLAGLGAALSMQGQVVDALNAFREATDLERNDDPSVTSLYSYRGIQLAGLLVLLGQHDDARTITTANMVVCERNEWGDDVARCRWLLGRLDTLAGAYAKATGHLAAATTVFREGHQLPDLVLVLIAQADLARRMRRWEDAGKHVEEALRIASSRGMLLSQADALVLRGRLVLEQTRGDSQRAAQALDDADAALSLAVRCGYAWAERDARRLKAGALAALGDRGGASAARRDEEAMTRRLAPTDLELDWVRNQRVGA